MATSYSPKIITDGLVLALDAGNIKSFRGEPTTNTVSFPGAGATRYNNPGFSGGITNTGLTYKGSPIWEVTFIPQNQSFISRLSSTEGFGFWHSMGTSLLPNTPYIASVYFKTDYPLASTTTQGFNNTYSNIGGWGNSGTSTTRFEEDGWTRLWTRFLNNITINNVNYASRTESGQNTVTVNTNATTDIIVTVNLLSNNTMTAATNINTSSAVGLIAQLVGFYSASPTIISTTISGMSTGTSTIINHGTETTNWTKITTANPLPKTSFPAQYYIQVRVPSTGGVNQTFVLRPNFNGYYTSITDNKFWKVTFNTSQLQVGDVIRTYWAAPMIEQRSTIFPTNFTIGTRGTTVATGGGWADKSGNSNHGELVNGPTFNSGNGGSIVFDGSNTYINLSGNTQWQMFAQSNNTIDSNFTIALWVYPTNIGTDQALVGQRHGDAMSLFLMSNGKISFEMDDTGNYTGTNTTLQNNNWYHIIVTFYNNTSNSYCEYYVNGKFERSETKWDGSGTGVVNDLWVGWQSRTTYGRNPGYFAGRMSNVQIYNRALTAAEVLQNFNATRGRFGI